MDLIELNTSKRSELVEITDRVAAVVSRSGVTDGVVFVQSLHTTAGLTINENADPDVEHDVVEKLGRTFPRQEPYFQHAEGNSDSHIKTSLMGPTLSVIVEGGDLCLGRWQGIYFCEWDGPRRRRVAVQVLGK